METKQKIKLLSDLQGALDNPELKELIINGMSSGEFIYKIFCEAVQNELNTILSGQKKETPSTIDKWENLLKTLDSSMVLQVLKSMNEKLQKDSPKVTTNTIVESERKMPPEDLIADSQEELKRKWEQQQISANTKRQRGGMAGPF